MYHSISRMCFILRCITFISVLYDNTWLTQEPSSRLYRNRQILGQLKRIASITRMHQRFKCSWPVWHLVQGNKHIPRAQFPETGVSSRNKLNHKCYSRHLIYINQYIFLFTIFSFCFFPQYCGMIIINFST
jgi:hypothetical protein